MTTNIERAVEVMRGFWHDGRYAVGFDEIARRLADEGLIMPDIPDGLNLIGFERKGGGGGLIWDDRITPAALTKGYAAMFSRLDNKEV